MRLFLFLLFFASAAAAQTYPDPQTTTVNDFADLLAAPEEVFLSKQLARLRRETGVEMTVVTLTRKSDYSQNQTLEQFATGLFNNWGIGNATRNDGVLILVLRDDREMRIELGAAYARTWDSTARHIVNSDFLPAFKNGDYPNGIKTGTKAVIDDIIMPFRAGEDSPVKSQDDELPLFLFAAFAIFVVVMKGRDFLGDVLARFRKCPNCGQRSIRQSRRVILRPTTSMPGSGVRRVECSYCGYNEEFSYYIAQVSNSSGSSGGFGGGRSGGGGASGRW